jgi:hypothetical protein
MVDYVDFIQSGGQQYISGLSSNVALPMIGPELFTVRLFVPAVERRYRCTDRRAPRWR